MKVTRRAPRLWFLAASALESTHILLNSRSSRFPEGLGNSSGQLGHYVLDHFTLEGARGFLPQFKSSRREARGTPCGFLIPKYVNTGEHVNKSFLRGYRFDGDGSEELYGHAFGLAGFGSDWRRKVRTEIPYYFAITALGECLPRYHNYVTLERRKERLLEHCCAAHPGQLRRERVRHGQGHG